MTTKCTGTWYPSDCFGQDQEELQVHHCTGCGDWLVVDYWGRGFDVPRSVADSARQAAADVRTYFVVDIEL